MNFKQHCLGYMIFYLIMLIVQYGHYTFAQALALCGVFFICNPDIDQLIPSTHRSCLTHSIILPIAFYWLFHGWWATGSLNEIGYFLFAATTLHLLLDMKPHNLKDGKKDMIGTYQIWVFGKRLPWWATLLWLLGNSVIMIIWMGVLL